MAFLALGTCILTAPDAAAGPWLRSPFPAVYEGGLHWDTSFPVYEVETRLARIRDIQGVVLLSTSQTLRHHPFTMGYFSAFMSKVTGTGWPLRDTLITDSLTAQMSGDGRAESLAPLTEPYLGYYRNGLFHQIADEKRPRSHHLDIISTFGTFPALLPPKGKPGKITKRY